MYSVTSYLISGNSILIQNQVFQPLRYFPICLTHNYLPLQNGDRTNYILHKKKEHLVTFRPQGYHLLLMSKLYLGWYIGHSIYPIHLQNET